MSLRKFIYDNKDRLKPFLSSIGYDYKHWTRTVLYQECFNLIKSLHPEQIDALEVSAGKTFQDITFKSFTEFNYPQFDICVDKLDKQFDLVIADQVFEHLLYPYRAGKNVFDMVKPGGHFLVATPFLIKIHPMPYDCTRWTETGMKYFLNECGFPLEGIQTWSWGNRACVKANFKNWAPRGWFGSLENESSYPVTVWALAKK